MTNIQPPAGDTIHWNVLNKNYENGKKPLNVCS